MFKLIEEFELKHKELLKHYDKSSENKLIYKIKKKKKPFESEILKEFIFQKNKIKNINKFIEEISFTKIQSPKLRNNIYRANSQHKLINLIKNNKALNQSKGTNLPAQFIRENFENIKELQNAFHNNFGLNSPKIIGRNRKKMTKSKSQDRIIENNKILWSIGFKERLYSPYLWKNLDRNKLKSQSDILMPEGFEFYEKLMKNEHKNFFKNNYIRVSKSNSIFPILIRKLIKEKSVESNIFYPNENKNYFEDNNNDKKGKKVFVKYLASDIFNERLNPSIIIKSGEKKFLKEQLNKQIGNKNNLGYNISSETSKGWGLREPVPSLLNHSSSQYNPLNPSIKNFSKTKEQIIQECKENFNGFNPINKQKNLSEFSHITRVGGPNNNIDYNKSFIKNPNIFRKNENMFTEYYLIHSQYKNISDKPFQRLLFSTNEHKSV